MQCSSYLEKTTNTPTLNGGDQGGVWILLYFEVTLFDYNVSTFLSLIVDISPTLPPVVVWGGEKDDLSDK